MSEIVRKIIPTPDGGVVFRSVQDVEPILEANRRELLAPKPSSRMFFNGPEVWVKVASIPNILLEQLWQQGLKFTDKDFLPRIKPMLNSAEFEKLRTAPGRI